LGLKNTGKKNNLKLFQWGYSPNQGLARLTIEASHHTIKHARIHPLPPVGFPCTSD